MKHLKKFASLALALAMVLSLSVTAFAAGNGSITVENPVEGQTYTAYKIFDVVYNENKTAYSYTISSTSDWYNTVNAYATQENGLTLTESASASSVYVVTTTSAFSAPDFAAALKTANVTSGGTELTVSEGQATATGLDLGYYFVTSTTGALCNLTTTNDTVTIRDKNDMPFEKTVDDDSVELGQTVTYTITAKVPDTTGFSSYTYKITDTMSSGLTFNKDVVVTIGGTTATKDTDYTVTDAVNGFTLNILNMVGRNAGDEIKVTYTATVNSGAVAIEQTNSAKLEYSNDPTNPEGITTPIVDSVTVYTAEIVIDKYDSDVETTKLSGAKFVLYKQTAEGNLYYKLTDGKVSWVPSQDQADTVTTGATGAAEFEGLEDGTYYLKEIEAPAGYNLLTNDVLVTINGAGENADLSVEADVPNSTGAVLPETGGMGTTIFYTLGAVMVIGAGVILVTKKRMA